MCTCPFIKCIRFSNKNSPRFKEIQELVIPETAIKQREKSRRKITAVK